MASKIIELYSTKGNYNLLPVVINKIKQTKKLEYIYIPIKSNIHTNIHTNIQTNIQTNIKIDCTIISYNTRVIPTSLIKQIKYYIDGTLGAFDNIKVESLNILIALNDIKKEFPTSNTMGMEHANNGVTTIFNKTPIEKYIYIFRTEDMFKVLVHEIIHYLEKDIDCTGSYERFAIHSLNAKWIDTRGAINFNEAYVEAMAIILYHKLCSNNNNNPYVGRGMRVAKALIDHANKYDNFYQNTNAISYYIYRAALLLHANEISKVNNCNDLLTLLEKSMMTFNKTINNFKPLKSMRVVFIK